MVTSSVHAHKAIIGIGFTMVLRTISQGYALSLLWGWFVVSLFGAPELGLIPAIGVAIVGSSFLIGQTHKSLRISCFWSRARPHSDDRPWHSWNLSSVMPKAHFTAGDEQLAGEKVDIGYFIAEEALNAVFQPFFVLFLGWVVHLFM